MTALVTPVTHQVKTPVRQAALLQGEIILNTRPYSAWGGAVTAQMYLPLERQTVWQQVTDYSRWVQYFPSMMESLVLPPSPHSRATRPYQRLYQAAGKTVLCFTAQVEVYLKVFEQEQATYQEIQFQLERGSFSDFSAALKLEDLQSGTLLTYSVQATPSIPIPTQIIQEGIRLDLPHNMESMRRVICQR
jgi:Polyketide cyclase / dehydrase and lipid transport